MPYVPTDEFAREWNRIRKKVDTLAFSGIAGKNNHDSIVVGPTSNPNRPAPQSKSLGIIFAVNLTQTGGSNGNKTTSASWTYTAKTLDNIVTLGTVLTPQRARPNGLRGAASLGAGYYDNTGAFKLYEALETPATGGC